MPPDGCALLVCDDGYCDGRVLLQAQERALLVWRRLLTRVAAARLLRYACAGQAALDAADEAKRASLDGVGAVGGLVPGTDARRHAPSTSESGEGGGGEAGEADEDAQRDRDYILGFTACKPPRLPDHVADGDAAGGGGGEAVRDGEGKREGGAGDGGGQRDKAGAAAERAAAGSRPAWNGVPGAGFVGGMGAGLGNVGDKMKDLPGASIVGSVGGGWLLPSLPPSLLHLPHQALRLRPPPTSQP
jgi:hypothetical protein